MLSIILHILNIACRDSIHALLPSQYKVSYTYSIAYSEPFGVKYRSHVGDWDVNITAMSPIVKSKLYYHEFEFNSSKLSPVLRENEIGGYYRSDIIEALLSVTGAKHLTTYEMEGILSIKEISLSYGFSAYYRVSSAISFYVSSGIGLVKIVQYQGFRRHSEDLYGSMFRVKFGVSYQIKPNLESYAGYSHRKDFWKYETDTIYDDEGNGVLYAFEDLKFPRHGVEVGVRFAI